MFRQTLFYSFNRDQWRNLPQNHAEKRLSQQTVADLQGEFEPVTRHEAETVYRPTAELLCQYYQRYERMSAEIGATFNGARAAPPYVIAVTGSVAVGKSTAARALSVLMGQWRGHPKIELVSVDSFIKSQKTLNAQGLARRKGFLESFDFDSLMTFLADLKSGESPLTIPVYSHRLYDLVDDDSQIINAPDVVVIEGLHLLNPYPLGHDGVHVLSDYFDFSIYVDAELTYIRQWFLERFLHLREKARHDDKAFFHKFALMDQKKALQIANDAWENINAPNYRQNIRPYRDRADLILSKDINHEVDKVWLRKG